MYLKLTDHIVCSIGRMALVTGSGPLHQGWQTFPKQNTILFKLVWTKVGQQWSL